MVYVEFTMEVARNKVQEALRCYQDKFLPWDKENVEKVGGKLIGYWYTEYGKTGEIIMMIAYPTLDAREKLLQALWQDEELQKELADWFGYTPTATVRVLRPAPFSPLQ